MKKEYKYEDNRFHQGRFEIGKIDEPVDIAAAIYAQRNGWDWTDGGEAEVEYREFMEYYRILQEKTTIAQNFVAEYFGV